MKRISLIILLAAITLSGMAQTIGEAFYIYRNDGQFNAFFRDEVQSIEYSNEDAEGKIYDEIVTQVVITADSVYKIPLAAIDSVGFVQPKTIIKNDVFPLTAEHSPYIFDADFLSFTMSDTTPDVLRPKVGDVVVATAECSAFPNGIIARVESIKTTDSGYHYTCSQAYYDEVFDQLISHMPAMDDDMSNPAQSFDLRRATLTATLWVKYWTKVIEGGGTTTTLYVRDSGTATVTICKTLTTPFYFQLQLQNTISLGIDEFNAKSTASIYKELQIGKTITAGKITIPYTMGLLWLEPKLSLFGYLEKKGSVQLKYYGSLNRTDKVTFTYTQKKWTFNHTPSTDFFSMHIDSLIMEGSAEVGLKPQIDFSLNGQQAGFGLSARTGLKEYTNFVFDMTKLSDGSLYDAMRDSYCRTTIPWGVTVHANANIFSRYDASQSDEGTATFSHTFAPNDEPQWGEDRYIFPLFNNVSGKRKEYNNNKADVSVSVSRTPMFPLQVGFSLLDKDDNLLQTQYGGLTYNPGNLFKNYTCEFSDLKSSEQYKVRPSVKLFGYDVLASPSAIIDIDKPICPDENHPHWIDLGIGTLWRCCNVRASIPEDYGGYYTFEKALTYNPPTLEQLKALEYNCTSVWCTRDGVCGCKITGPNGGTIFLPAAGIVKAGELREVNTVAYYWSSTPHPDFEDDIYAYEMDISNHYKNWCSFWFDYIKRSHGLSVRPVR